MKLSVIIPVFNAEETLARCLEAIVALQYPDLEIIVVDDKSADASVSVAERFGCKIIRLSRNAGSGTARNAGADQAAGDILVFIDSDVVVGADTFSMVQDVLTARPDVIGVSGRFAAEHPHKKFFSQYKNLYMHYVFGLMPDTVDFLFGSVCAVRKDAFKKFPEERMKADDTDLGQRYKVEGQHIGFEKKLEVTHLKKYTFASLIKNDFIVPMSWAGTFLKYRGFKDVVRTGRFAHARGSQLISVALAAVILVLALASTAGIVYLNLAIALFGTFLILNSRFYVFLFRSRGLFFAVRGAAFSYLDALVMAAGILAGAFLAVMRQIYKKF